MAGLGAPVDAHQAGNIPDLATLPAPVRAIFESAFGDATGHLFLVALPFAVLALVCVLFIKEVPLRTTVRIGDSAENATAGVAGAASPAEEAPRVTEAATATGPARATETAGAADTTVAVGVHRARVANPDRIQASSAFSGSTVAQLDDPLERTAVGALDVLTAAQDTARRHMTASHHARGEVSDLLGAVGNEVEAALRQLQHSLADIRRRLVSDEVTRPSEGRDGAGADSLRSYEYGLLLNTQQTVNGIAESAQREAQRIVNLANAEVVALEQRIEQLRSVEAELAGGVSGSLRGNAVR
jgi:hypothetical protein